MSVWQTPHATRRTSTSPAFGSASSTSWTTSGAPNSSSTAARILIMAQTLISNAMWALFDLNGTLVDPGVLLDPPELPVAALDEANVMAMITVIAGAQMEFKPLLDAALRRGLERAGRDPGLAAGALEKLPEMPAYPEVPEALGRVRAGGRGVGLVTR